MITFSKNNATKDIKAFIEDHRQRIDSALKTLLPPIETSPAHLHQAMHYSVLNGGKRVRPLLVYATGAAFNIDSQCLDFPAAAIEFIHAYSLVHDDLPAMDNDDLRRGKPTCHKAFDEATAILVGDALQTLAFSTLTSNSSLPPEACIGMVRTLAKASGSLGMAGGQDLDLKATGKTPTMEDLERIHHLKTGALIVACVQLALLAGSISDAKIHDDLLTFATHIGLCFQIQDDILNAEGKMARLGKKVGSDAQKNKATFVTVLGSTAAKQKLHLFYEKALGALESFGEQMNILRALAHFIIQRDH